jgi:hypothetical protein
VLSLTCPRQAIVKCAALQYLVLVSGCMSWRTEPVAPSELVQRNPPVVRITQSDSSRLILRHLEVRGDTLYGSPQDSLGGDAKQRVGIPLSNITSVETRRGDPNKTVILAAGVAVGTLTALCLLADALGCGDDPVFAVSGSVR